MNYPKEYVEYLAHFHGDRDYFECHEVLEEYWKSLPEREMIWVGFIQVAVGIYHHRRGNVGGAVKMLRSSLTKMTSETVETYGIHYRRLVDMIEERIEEIERGKEYVDFNLPISDPTLRQLAKEECERRGWIWEAPSSMEDSLIHRHSLRDRSGVIQARQEQLKLKGNRFNKN